MVLDHVPVVIRFQVCIFDILNTAYNKETLQDRML